MGRPLDGTSATAHPLALVAAAMVLLAGLGAGMYATATAGAGDGTTATSGGDGSGDAPALEATVCPTGMAAIEPTIGATSTGHLFMQAGSAVPSGVARSDGGCGPWDDVTPRILGIPHPPQSNDPYVHVDPVTDRVFNLNMQGLQCNYLSFSDDLGGTWTTNPLGCGHPAGTQDHPTLFTGPPANAVDAAALEATGHASVVYLCVNRVVDTACARSLDGGLTFGEYRPLVFTGPDPDYGSVAWACSGLTAHGITGPDGVVYLASTTCSNGAVDDTVPEIAISRDGAITWDRVRIPTASDVLGHEVQVALDAAGSLYAAWPDIAGVTRLSVSHDDGRTWSPDIPVAPEGVNTASFTTLAAGAGGHVVVGFYGTDQTAREVSTEGFDGHGTHARVMDGDATWHGYLAVSTDAHTASPTFSFSRATPDDQPLAEGNCNAVTRCGDVYDFLDITLDPDGRPWAAMVRDGPGNGRGLVATLVSGPSLLGGGALPALPTLTT